MSKSVISYVDLCMSPNTQHNTRPYVANVSSITCTHVYTHIHTHTHTHTHTRTHTHTHTHMHTYIHINIYY